MDRTCFNKRPAKTEYFDYYDRYVCLVPGGNITEILETQLRSALVLFRNIPDEKSDFRYDQGKWSIKEVLRHVIDIEWIFSYRALMIARISPEPIQGVDQDKFASGIDTSLLSPGNMIEEFHGLRSANIRLFQGFDETVLGRKGKAGGRFFTVRSIIYIIAGHAAHHLEFLKNNYLL